MEKLQIRAARKAEIVDELAQHLEDRFEEFRAEGADESEAYRMALMELSERDVMAAALRKTEPGEERDAVPSGAARSSYPLSDLARDFR